MKGFLILVFALIAVCQGLTFNNCGNPLLKIDSLVQNPMSDKIDANTKITATFTATSTYTDPNMKAVLDINVQKKIFWGHITIPNFVFSLVAPAIENVIPGVKHLSGSKFEIGCQAAKQFLKTCPPKAGTYTVDIDLSKAFQAIKSKAGAAGSFIGSGNYKVDARATLPSQDNKELACANFEANIKL